MNFAACVTNDKTLDMIPKILNELYKKYTGCDAAEITELPSSGSNRRYFRLSGEPTLIGVVGTSVE